MANNAQTTPFARSIVNYTRSEIDAQIQQLGQALPVSVVAVNKGMVTVSFDVNGPITFPQIEVPQAISRYARPPTQVGDKGFVVAADAYLDGSTGLGTGTSTYNQLPPNLSALVFLPLANTSFPTVDANAYNITGPNGCVIKDDSGASVITLTPSSITLSCGGHSIVINSSGVIIDGKVFLTHQHSGVEIGPNATGNVV
jgi:hypothetical protein